MSLRAVKGMKDILPDEISKWQRLENAFRARAERYGFREARFPIVEPTALFVRSIGENTDIVEKEMYTFDDRNGDSLTLRPEGTIRRQRSSTNWNHTASSSNMPRLKATMVGSGSSFGNSL